MTTGMELMPVVTALVKQATPEQLRGAAAELEGKVDLALTESERRFYREMADHLRGAAELDLSHPHPRST